MFVVTTVVMEIVHNCASPVNREMDITLFNEPTNYAFGCGFHRFL